MRKVSILFSASVLFLASCVGNPEGKKAETTNAMEVTTADGETLPLDLDQSKLFWEGHKVTGKHNGEVAISEGSVLINPEGKLTGGSFTINMNSIDVQDLTGDSKDKLTGHLKSDDFFSVETFPEAKFEISSVQDGAEENQLIVSGNLTLKGVTKNITFDAVVEASSAEKFAATADFNIEREEFGVMYAGKADDLISKEINIKINLVAQKG